jgi:hypothetical protein
MLKPGTEAAYLAATNTNLCYPPQAGDYGYFEGPRFRGNSGFSFGNAAFAADASMLAYARHGEARMTEDGFMGILRDAGFETRETIGDCFVAGAAMGRGFFAAGDDFAILAFRGTEADDWHDLVADLKGPLVAQKALGGPAAGRVHEGFQGYLEPVWDRVAGLVAAYRAAHAKQEICITGHSLGAALATLAFQQLQDEHTSLYTFGCPRVGDAEFCASVSEMAERRGGYRFADHEDLVTHVAPTELIPEYGHPNCALVWIDSTGAVTLNPPNPPTDGHAFRDLPWGIWKE